MILCFHLVMPFIQTDFRAKHIAENYMRWTLVSTGQRKRKRKRKRKRTHVFIWKLMMAMKCTRSFENLEYADSTFSWVKNCIRWIMVFYNRCYRTRSQDQTEHISRSSLANYRPANWHRLNYRITGSGINLLNSARLNCLGCSPSEFVQFDLELLFVLCHPARKSLINPHWKITNSHNWKRLIRLMKTLIHRCVVCVWVPYNILRPIIVVQSKEFLINCGIMW